MSQQTSTEATGPQTSRCSSLTDEVAWLLASYAREALARVEKAQPPALDAVRGALEQALDIQFDSNRGEHFFRSTFV